MKKMVTIMTLVMCVFSGSLFAQVFADFEDGTAMGFVDNGWGTGFTSIEAIADPTADAGYVLAMNFDVSGGQKGVIEYCCNVDPGMATMLSYDVFIPTGFPDSAYIDFWAQDNVSWSWGPDEAYNGYELPKNSWTTLSFHIADWVEAGYQLTEPGGIGKMGLQVQDYTAGSTFAGQLLIDNINFTQEVILYDFEDGTAQGWVDNGWGTGFSSIEAIADPTGGSGTVFAMNFDASAGQKGVIEYCCNVEVGNAYVLQYDVYIPAGFPDSAYIDYWAQENVNWAWGPDDTYFGVDLPKGNWVTLDFFIADWVAAGFNFYDPAAIGKMGLQVQDFTIGSTFAGQLLIDNIRLATFPVDDNWVVADFENEAGGTMGFINLNWNPGLVDIGWVADPTGSSGGVLTSAWDFSQDFKGAFENASVTLLWDSTGGVMTQGASAIAMDVYIPADMPWEGADVSIFYRDHDTWTWTEYKFPIVPADSAAGDSAVYVGQWSTVKYDVIEKVDAGEINPYVAGGVGFQVIQPAVDTPTWAGPIYFDNLTLVGVAAPPQGVVSPIVLADVEFDSNQGFYQSALTWLDNEAGTESYNVYKSDSEITDVAADGVVRIATGIPHGTEAWNHRPWSSNGSETTLYYAVTAVTNGGEETVLTADCKSGAMTLASSETPKVMYVEDFASTFVLDGLDTEFQAYSEYAITPNAASGSASDAWTTASTDMNFGTTFIIDANYLYISASVTDDDLRAAPYQAWQGDAIEFYLGFYDVSALDAYHTKGDVDGGNGDWRISFITDGSTQASGFVDFDFPGLESTAYQAFTGDGYIVEARASLDSLGLGNDFSPANGTMMPLKIDGTDQDPVLAGDEERSLLVQWGAMDNVESWLRPSSWAMMEVIGVTSTDATTLPYEYRLYDNYPNPFNPTTVLKYELASRSQVEVIVYNVLGEEVRRLVNDTKSAGSYEVTWDGLDHSGHSVSSGLYLYRLTTPEFTATQKMTLLR